MARILYTADIEHAYDNPERIGRLAGLIAGLRTPSDLVCLGGDTTAPGVLPLKSERVTALPFLETVRPDADTLGNHEFDRSRAALAELCRQSPQTWVCANVRDETGDWVAAAGIEPWTILPAGDERVGVFGVAAPDTDRISPLAADLTFSDPVPAAREAVATLRERDVDAVVGLSHVGEDDPLARALDVPAILGGHVHEPRETVVDDTLLVRPGAGGRRLAAVEVGESGASVTWHRTADAPPEPTLVRTYRDRLATLGLDEPVTEVAEPVVRVANTGESAVGNFVADALRAAATADVGLMHGGSIRADDPLSGTVTAADLVSLVPFDNDVVAVDLDGERLRAVLRDAAGVHLDRPGNRRWYGQLSNVRLVWDHETASIDRATVGGAEIDPDASYRLGTVDYVLSDEGLFRSLDRSLPHRTVGDLHDTLVGHAHSAGLPTAPEGRIRRLNREDD